MSPQVLHRESARTRTFALAVAGAFAASMLVVNPAASGLPTDLQALESALCPIGSSAAGPVKLTKDINAVPISNIETLTIVEGCETILDLDGFKLIVGNVVIEPTAKLTIRDTSTAGTGVLDATAGIAGFPGISVDWNGSDGNLSRLVIESGTVKATGGAFAAGIGGSCRGGTPDPVGSGTCSGGTVIFAGEIIITGGVVEAQGGAGAAGIGNAPGARTGNEAQTLSVEGGTITATGGAGGAGIGGGPAIPDNSNLLDTGIRVSITGGTVNAFGGANAAGIGTGAVAGTLTVRTGGIARLFMSTLHGGGSLFATAGAGFPNPVGTDGQLEGLGNWTSPVTTVRILGTSCLDPVIEHTLNPVKTSITYTDLCPAPVRPPSSPRPSGVVTSGSAAVDVPVSAAVAAASAAGVAGSSSAVLVRGGEVVPITSSSAAGAGPRGGVVLEAEGLRVTVAAAGGASRQTGVVAPVGGEIVCELCAAFAAGSTIEAWMYSSPQLAAAVQVPDDHEDGECILLRIPVGDPLTGEPVAAGAHTLQLRMYAQDGLEVLATGVTVGTAVPSGIPAGDGPVDRGLLGMFGLLAVAGAVAVRRLVVTG